MSKPPVLDYESTEPQKRSRLGLLHYLVIIFLVSLFISIVLPSNSRHRVRPGQVMCGSNLRQLGQGLQLYAQDNGGLFPPDLQTLAGTQPIELAAMVCPSTNDSKPKNVASIGDPAACSYIYVDTGLTSKAKPDCILALEDPANHELRGGNVLFVDGHVEFILLDEIQHILNELNAGRNPPTNLSPTLSQATAEQDYQTNWKPRMPQLKSGGWRIPTTQPTKPQ